MARQPPRPAAVQAEDDAGDPPAAAQGDADPPAASKASPFEIRYLIAYLLMLIFIGGSAFLVIRPSGRKIQGQKANGKESAKAKK